MSVCIFETVNLLMAYDDGQLAYTVIHAYDITVSTLLTHLAFAGLETLTREGFMENST